MDRFASILDEDIAFLGTATIRKKATCVSVVLFQTFAGNKAMQRYHSFTTGRVGQYLMSKRGKGMG